MVRIRDGTPPERLRPIIGRFSSNNDGCILFQRVFIDTDRENALSLAKFAYNREIGRPLDVKARLEEPALPEVLQGGEAALVECAVRENAAIEGIKHADAALAAQAKAEKGAYLPQVALAGGWMRQDDPYLARDRGWVVGVTMKWITEIGKKRAALEHQKAEAGSLVELAVRQCLLNVRRTNASASRRAPLRRPTRTCAPCASATATGSSPTPRCSMRRRSGSRAT